MLLLNYFLVLFICLPVFAQTVYKLQPGTKNNSMELNLTNSTGTALKLLNVAVQEKPDWVIFKESSLSFEEIAGNGRQSAEFIFDVDLNAPLGENGTIKFIITNSAGKSWLKTFDVITELPTKFELAQNYPNPFNPVTTIKYSLPQNSFVTLKVFNVLGEQVALLVNSNVNAGVHDVVFNANSISSGFYFYTIEAKGNDGTKYFETRKMILLK